jgi:hypothetical protein
MSTMLMARVATVVLSCAFAVLPITGAQASTISPSDLGPVGWSAGAGDPNLGVLNDETHTLNFDGGWRFALVNTKDAGDPSGTYGTSSDPKADAPGFDDSAWQKLTLPHGSPGPGGSRSAAS